MKIKLKLFLPIAYVLFFIACNDKPTPKIDSTDFSENYKYFPIKDGREWNYEIVIVDSTKGTTVVSNELARYVEDSSRTIYFRNGVQVSSLYWNNINNRLGCCGDVVLLDYNLLQCASDSILIYHKETTNSNISIYQYCEKKFAIGVAKYDKIECIKTRQLNIFSDGHSLLITNYFGFGVGLVYRQETYFDKTGKIYFQQTQKLVSHNF